jgi:SpoVK/Ycf46/Vps4 family AAA+-type ATPase
MMFVSETVAIDAPYRSAWEFLQDQLERLNVRLALLARRRRRARVRHPLEAFKGLVVSEEEVVGLLDELIESGDDNGAQDDDESVRRIDDDVSRRIDASRRDPIDRPLARLARLFHLTAFEMDTLLVCVAPEIDRRYEKVYGYLQDDITQKRPTVGLVLDLLCRTDEERLAARPGFDPEAPLIRYRLCRLTETAAGASVPLLSRALALDDRIVQLLLGYERVDARLAGSVRLFLPDDSTPLVVDDSLVERMRAVALERSGNGVTESSTLFHLSGPPASGTRTIAEAVCRALGVPMIAADVNRLLSGSHPFADAIWLLAREAIVRSAALCLDEFDAILDDPVKSAQHLRALLDAVRLASKVSFVLGDRPWIPETQTEDQSFFGIRVTLPDNAASRDLWEAHARALPGVDADVDWNWIASRFRFGPDQVRDALSLVPNIARWRSTGPARITMADVNDACRTVGATRLTTLAQKVERRGRWDDIVLPARPQALLHELANEARYRSLVLGQWGFEKKLRLGAGLTSLFFGPPGTGKTMAAQIVASELELDLYRIDLSQVVSKYIGDTEKHLKEVFDDADATRAILFFDEADALFGKRSDVKDAHDRYANIEVGYLLQRLDEFEGIAILATNLRHHLDEAFVRRMRFIIEFSFPDEEQRLGIWQVTFPAEAPLGPDVDLRVLAREVRLAGGYIRNIALAAAFYAAGDGGVIRMSHLMRAAAREYEKLGRIWNESAPQTCEVRL